MKIEARKDGVIYCVYHDESMLPDAEVIKNMKAAGYKLYAEGRLYKLDNKKEQNDAKK